MSTATLTSLVLEELAVPCERVKLDLKKGESRTPEFLKLNPNGKVPVIVHNGTVIFESAAITLYLGEAFGTEKALWPAVGPQRGEAMKWVVWGSVTLSDAVYRWARNTSNWAPPEQQNAKAGETGKADMMNCLRILDDALARKDYLVGGAYTLADTHLTSLIDWLGYMKVDLAAYASLGAWHKRCTARPAYAKAAARETA
jgi:glutathione S-transferase